MKHFAPFTGILLSLLVVNCTADQSLAPIGKVPTALTSQATTCYAVKADFTGAPSGPWSFTGVLAGDLVGTLTLDFDPGSLRFAGVTIKNGGTAQWSINGGTLPAPLAFETVFENQNLTVDRPGSPALVFENIGRHRASSGVATANLQYKGSFAVVPALEVVHRYHGVICL